MGVDIVTLNAAAGMVGADMGATAELGKAVAATFAGPLAYTRLEPQSVSGDPSPAERAAVHDPLWMLNRQWQFGEFVGEDDGHILGTSVRWSTQPLATITTGSSGSRPIVGEDPLDPVVETGAALPASPRARAEAGQALALALADGPAQDLDLTALYPFAVEDVLASPAALRPVLRANPDAGAVAAALAGPPPAWAPPGSTAAAAAAEWLTWYRANVEQTQSDGGWDRSRLEYGFSVSTTDGRQLGAVQHSGGAVDWWNLDASTQGQTMAAAPVEQEARLLAQPLRFPGMPANRYFEFEDGSFDLGGIDIEPNDPARRALVQYATLYGSDWFSIPLEVPAHGLTTVTELTVTDTFGVATLIPPAASGSPDAPFRLFQLTSGDQVLPGLLTLPSTPTPLEGDPLEATVLLRDESANMGWAVEERVEGPDGRARIATADGEVEAEQTGEPNDAELAYILETDVPPNWIPLVPVSVKGMGGFVLRKGTMTGTDDCSSLLLAGSSVDIFDEEIRPRGVRVERVQRVARNSDGGLRRWTAFHVRTANYRVSSRLAYDGATA